MLMAEELTCAAGNRRKTKGEPRQRRRMKCLLVRKTCKAVIGKVITHTCEARAAHPGLHRRAWVLIASVGPSGKETNKARAVSTSAFTKPLLWFARTTVD